KFLASRARATPGAYGMSESRNVGGSPSRRRLIKAALAGLAAPAVLRIGTAFAAYPDRPVRIVVANTPGGPSDIIARFMAAAMQRIGTTPQLQAEGLKLREGLQKMATIPFPGGGDALKALLSGTVQLSSGVLAPAHPQIKAGAIKGLAVTGRARWHDLPDIPTMLEAGYPDFVFDTYTALMAPAKTPPEIVGRLEKVVLEILRRPEIRERLTQSGFEVTAKSGKEHMARVAREVPMFADIIARADIKKL